MKDNEKIMNHTEDMELNEQDLEQATGGCSYKSTYTHCAYCGKGFYDFNGVTGRDGKNYCSNSCWNKVFAEMNMPSWPNF